ncbi:phytanoyl-CoA dioxygenase family protein [Actinomadura hibisca]|uniref:phytanoyl-CoA dioxygenase family protein n=1 Tax=Actinomadura hibisca TaxID=68565 RepID=UPI000A01A4ED|nr:phytanoyl-CoA dioxygenase family protein [Actinomadura hibisca]
MTAPPATTGPARHDADHDFDLDRDGLQIIRGALLPGQRATMLQAAHRLLASPLTQGRDRGPGGNDGFRGVLDLDEAFEPLLDNPAVLAPIAHVLGANLWVLSSHLIALPSHTDPATRTVRTPDRPGWHRDMYGVTADLGHTNTPRMAIKAAYYLTGTGPDTGVTMFLPGSHHAAVPPVIAPGQIDPPGAITPRLADDDAVLFENRTWHAGGLNTSGRPRIAVMIQYGFRWLARVDDPPLRLTPDRANLTPVQRQLLGTPDRAADGSLALGSGSAALAAWLTKHPPTNR